MNDAYLIYGDDLAYSDIQYNKLSNLDASLEKISFQLTTIKDIDIFFDSVLASTLFSSTKIIKIDLKSKLLKNLTAEKYNLTGLAQVLSTYKKVFLIVGFDKWDKSSKSQLFESDIFKQLNLNKAHMIECVAFKPWDIKAMSQRIKDLALEEKLSFDTEAINFFIEIIKNDFSVIYSELPKIKTYLMPNTKITKEVLDEIYSKSSNVDDLISAILNNKYNNVSNILSSVTELNSPIYTLAILQNRFRQYLELKYYADAGYHSAQIAKLIGIHPYRVDLMLREVQKVSYLRLKNIVLMLSDYEFKAKTGSIPSDSILDNLVVSTIN